MAAGSNIADLEEEYFTQAQSGKQIPRIPLDIGQHVGRQEAGPRKSHGEFLLDENGKR